jgi:hypothetical protein
VYVLDDERRVELAPGIAETLRAVTGVDLCARLAGTADAVEAVVFSPHGELRFAPGGELSDVRGETWSVEGDLGALGLTEEDGRLTSRTHPDALRRLWAALACRNSGDVLCSATPGYEFVDWGGADHIGGGSHGSLHRHDSLGALLACGIDGMGRGAPGPDREQWSIEDVTPLVLDHFGVRADVARQVG